MLSTSMVRGESQYHCAHIAQWCPLPQRKDVPQWVDNQRVANRQNNTPSIDLGTMCEGQVSEYLFKRGQTEQPNQFRLLGIMLPLQAGSPLRSGYSAQLCGMWRQCASELRRLSVSLVGRFQFGKHLFN